MLLRSPPDPRYWFDIPHGGTITTRDGEVLTRVYLESVLGPKGGVSAPEGYTDGKIRVRLHYGKSSTTFIEWPDTVDVRDAFRQLLLAMARMLVDPEEVNPTPPPGEFAKPHTVRPTTRWLIGTFEGGVMEDPQIRVVNKDIILADSREAACSAYNLRHRCNYYYGGAIASIDTTGALTVHDAENFTAADHRRLCDHKDTV